MSRIGKNPIEIPSDVTVTIDKDLIVVKGPKGELSLSKMPVIDAKIDDNHVVFNTEAKTKQINAAWGLMRALVANMIKGVTVGFEKKLELVGVGYRAAQNGNGLTMNIGYSHPVSITAPAGIQITVVDNQNITISGADKQLVGQVAAKIRKVRQPEPYKGKGIKYSTETVRRKAGKSGKA